jgi:hypothetical protein
MSLTLGGPVTFEPLVPGIARDYTAATTVRATSSARTAVLTVSDRGTVAPGHLVNGDLALPQALQVAAGGPFAPLGAQATVLKTFSEPVANEVVNLEFKQPVGANDKLLAGHYGKRVTFTLATTTP